MGATHGLARQASGAEVRISRDSLIIPILTPHRSADFNCDGKAEDYIAVHSWFDESKAFFPDFRHRALRHHSQGIFMAERLFGASLVNSDGRVVAVRYLSEQHVREDLGRIPTHQDWLVNLKPTSWMYGQKLELKKETKTQIPD